MISWYISDHSVSLNKSELGDMRSPYLRISPDPPISLNIIYIFEYCFNEAIYHSSEEAFDSTIDLRLSTSWRILLSIPFCDIYIEVQFGLEQQVMITVGQLFDVSCS